MGHIKHIKSNLDPQAFPGATFEIAGQVPEAQCSEAKIEGDHGITTSGGQTLTDIGAFIGFNLTDKDLTIVSPFENAGEYYIVNNTDDLLNLVEFTPKLDPDNVYYIHDGGELILTRNIQSFAEFIHAAGYAYTIKGAKLHTNMPSNLLKDACTILFDPLT